jgi:leucyl aminopeptidase
MVLQPMHVSATTSAPSESGADTVAVGVFEDEGVAHDLEGAPLGALLDSGEARRAFRHLAVAHAGGLRWLLVGLGKREAFDGERARLAAAAAHGRAKELGARTLCWEVPHHVGDEVVEGLVHGTVLAAYRFARYREDSDEGTVERLVVSAHHDWTTGSAGGAPGAVERATIVAEAQNAARDLQNTPANDLTPTALGERALALAAEVEGLKVEVHGPDFLTEQGMGAFLSVSQGSYEEPRLIVLRHEPAGAQGPLLGLVGKAVTFDSGGISIKPAANMWNMKFDMSGGAAVVEAMGAIARLGLPVRVVAVVGSTENLPSGRSVKPGDIVTARGGTTIEVNNTDAEGRLVLADCLTHARDLGAERLVDVATLTGGVITALGNVHAGLMANDEDWAAAVLAASAASGELVWRLPLHPLYADMVKGTYAQLQNAGSDRGAHPIQGAEFLHHFAGDVPWAHLDIAGVSDGVSRAYNPKGGTGFGVRLLVELVRAQAQAPAPTH